jgi:hypothetical protein
MTTERIEAFWENATAEDVARVMAGETVEARFRDDETSGWQMGELTGFSLKACRGRWQTYPYYFCECQVYREPSYWTKRPDPGPGYRLLGKMPDEELKEYDEWWNGVHWGVSFRFASGPQSEGVWYRRRIEAEAPSPAKVRVDLALAAYSLRAAVANMRYAEAQKDKMSEAMLDAFVASGKTEVVVKIDGDHYFFWAGGTGVFFREIEVL